MEIILMAALVGIFSVAPQLERAPHDEAEQSVQRALDVISDGRYTGSTEKDLEGLGDASARALITIYSDRNLDPRDIKAALLILDLSFAAPKLIARETDRSPRATLLLLKYMECQTHQPELTQQIADTKRAVGRAVPAP